MSNSETAIEIEGYYKRNSYVKEIYGKKGEMQFCNLEEYYPTAQTIFDFMPDVIINLAAQPSAPFSMQNIEEALETQQNNNSIVMNLLWAIKEKAPKCRLMHISTMGEYGQPNFPIPEHSLRVNHKTRSAVIPLGRAPLSFYHASKVLDTHNIFLACKNWGISAQIFMTGVVYGVNSFIHADDPRSATRFDFDKYFGTVINRFVAQTIIDHDITIYGKGDQIRAFISLEDFVESIVKAIDQNIPSNKENPKFIVYNQVTYCTSINNLAKIVMVSAALHGSKSQLKRIKNPRTEKEDHFYEVETEKFDKIHKKTRNMSDHIEDMIEALSFKECKAIIERYKDAI